MTRWIEYYLVNNKIVGMVLWLIVGMILYFEQNYYFIILLAIFLIASRKLLVLVVIGLVVGYIYSWYYYSQNVEWVAYYYGQEFETEGIVTFVNVNGVDSQIDFETDEYGKIRIYRQSLETIHVGSRVLVKGKLQEPQSSQDFDFKEYLRTLNINYIVYSPEIEILEGQESLRGWILLRLGSIRFDFAKYFRRNYPEPHSSLLIGMTLGIETDFPKSFDKIIRVTGTSHIIAVSGFNVLLVINLINQIGGKLNKRLGLWLSLIFVVLFWLIVGVGNQPATRAVLINLVYLGMEFWGRKSNRLNALVYVVAAMLISNPYLHKSLSLLLSLSALWGIWSLTEIIDRKLQVIPPIFRSELSSTIAATIGTLPLTLFYFKSFSPFGVLVNMFVLPLVPIITINTFIEYFVGFMSNGKTLIHLLNGLAINLMVWLLRLGEYIEFSYIENINVSGILFAFMMVSFLFVIAKVHYKNFKDKLFSIYN